MTMGHHAFTAASAGTIRPDLLIAASLAMAESGDAAGYFDLGMTFSSGSHGTPVDLIEAAQRHYAYDEAEARAALAAMSERVQDEWRTALAEEGMPPEAIERYRGAFAPLA